MRFSQSPRLHNTGQSIRLLVRTHPLSELTASSQTMLALSIAYTVPMTKVQISGGVVHDLPDDLRVALLAEANLLELWEDLTPLARNEWICWVEDAQRQETRTRRIRRVRSELQEGKRRPCCWSGCPHRAKTGKP